MNKQSYQTWQLSIIQWTEQDVVTTSGDPGDQYKNDIFDPISVFHS